MHSVALDVGKRDLSSPCALFITRAFVISFDVFGCNVSALYNSALKSFGGSADSKCCMSGRVHGAG